MPNVCIELITGLFSFLLEMENLNLRKRKVELDCKSDMIMKDIAAIQISRRSQETSLLKLENEIREKANMVGLVVPLMDQLHQIYPKTEAEAIIEVPFSRMEKVMSNTLKIIDDLKER